MKCLAYESGTCRLGILRAPRYITKLHDDTIKRAATQQAPIGRSFPYLAVASASFLTMASKKGVATTFSVCSTPSACNDEINVPPHALPNGPLTTV